MENLNESVPVKKWTIRLAGGLLIVLAAGAGASVLFVAFWLGLLTVGITRDRIEAKKIRTEWRELRTQLKKAETERAELLQEMQKWQKNQNEYK